VSGLLERLSPAESRSRRGRLWLVVGLVLVLLAAAAWAVGFSSVFGVRSVTVKGNHLVSAKQVRQVAAVVRGEPLARLDKQAIERRVEQLPAVRQVKVATSFPSTVTITVIERTPVGFRRSGGASVLVDAENVEFRTLPSAPPGLPQMQDGANSSLNAVAVDVAASLPDNLRKQVALVLAPSSQSVTLQLVDGRTFVWGGAERAGEKVRLMQALLTQPGTYFDLSDPNSVISRGAPNPAPTN